MIRFLRSLVALAMIGCCSLLVAQEQSVRPGINDAFQDPNVEAFVERFETESREVFANREQIVAACQLKAGQTVADIGAGTGLFTRLFSKAVGNQGQVLAVDIAQKFLDHIQTGSRQAGLRNVSTVLCKADSTELPAQSVDVAFICDTYHHFEFPAKTMASLRRALKPQGRVVLIDFRRIEGKSSEWTLSHVRAGQEVFEAEVVAAGFKKVREEPKLLDENYFVVFEKASDQDSEEVDDPDEAAAARPQAKAKLVHPVIAGHGGVVPRPQAAHQPQAGAKVVFDVTGANKPSEIHKSLDRVARLLNLYGAAGLTERDVKISLVLHGEATHAAMTDAAYRNRFGIDANPSLPLVRKLKTLGVEILVCGQALNYQGYADEDVAQEIAIAAAALTAVINLQSEGYAYIPMP